LRQVYDTVLDPAKWMPALGAVGDFVGAARVTLIMEDAVAPQQSVTYQSYFDPEWLERYLTTYLMINPMRVSLAARRVVPGDVILTKDYSSAREYGRTRFSREFLADRDIVDVAVGVLERTPTRITVLSLKRSRVQGFAGEDVRRKIGLIAPHVQLAASIGRAFERKVVAASTLTAALDRLTVAMFLLDRAGAVVYANRSAHKMVGAGAALRSMGGVLTPRDTAAAADLKNALAWIARSDTSPELHRRLIKFADTPEGALAGSIMPLTSGARLDAGSPLNAMALLSVQPSPSYNFPDADALGRLYELTPRETSVLMAIVEGCGVPETAAILGLSVGTTRTHLKSIFQKTGATRQAELVKRVAGMASPFG
jgi:DNA-binding CsgD family transcriptional regulator/PAS domain-containing protein